MKKFLLLLLSAVMIISMAGCAAGKTAPDAETAAEQAEEPPALFNKTLVVYFSATGNTRNVAVNIASVTNADLHEIVPEVPYTDADLDYNSDCRANREQNDDAARPAINGGEFGIEQYDVIFLGYPIWWGQAPKIMYSFLESHDFTGKTIIPFCTSGSSSIGTSAENMRASAPSAEWLDGQRFTSSASREDLTEWINGLDIGIKAE